MLDQMRGNFAIGDYLSGTPITMLWYERQMQDKHPVWQQELAQKLVQLLLILGKFDQELRG